MLDHTIRLGRGVPAGVYMVRPGGVESGWRLVLGGRGGSEEDQRRAGGGTAPQRAGLEGEGVAGVGGETPGGGLGGQARVVQTLLPTPQGHGAEDKPGGEDKRGRRRERRKKEIKRTGRRGGEEGGRGEKEKGYGEENNIPVFYNFYHCLSTTFSIPFSCSLSVPLRSPSPTRPRPSPLQRSAVVRGQAPVEAGPSGTALTQQVQLQSLWVWYGGGGAVLGRRALSMPVDVSREQLVRVQRVGRQAGILKHL